MSSRKRLWQILESRRWEILSEEKSKVRILHCFWSPHFDQFASIGHIHSCGPPPILNWVSHITFRARLRPRGNICQICGNHPQIQISNILKKCTTHELRPKQQNCPLIPSAKTSQRPEEIFGTHFKGKEGSRKPWFALMGKSKDGTKHKWANFGQLSWNQSSWKYLSRVVLKEGGRWWVRRRSWFLVCLDGAGRGEGEEGKARKGGQGRTGARVRSSNDV